MPQKLTAPFTTLSHPSIVAPKGFHADGQHVGLKHKAKDLGWLISDVPAAVAGVFTTNQIQAAPVQLTKKTIQNGQLQAIIVNSGNANAVTGQVQPALTEAFRQHGIAAIGLNAGSNQLLTGHVLDQALYGYVGVIHQVNTQLIQQLWQQNLIPIIAPLAMTNDGQWLNVNADHAATAIAKQLHADALYLLTDVAGVKVSGCLLQALTPKTVQHLTADHLVTGGMIPKINSALNAVKRGVHHVHITNTVTQPGTVVTL